MHGKGIAGRQIDKKMIQILEIWTNEEGTEYAAKISGHASFLKTTSHEAKYTRIIYAAPYLEGYIEDLKEQLEKIIDAENAEVRNDQLRRPR